MSRRVSAAVRSTRVGSVLSYSPESARRAELALDIPDGLRDTYDGMLAEGELDALPENLDEEIAATLSEDGWVSAGDGDTWTWLAPADQDVSSAPIGCSGAGVPTMAPGNARSCRAHVASITIDSMTRTISSDFRASSASG